MAGTRAIHAPAVIALGRDAVLHYLPLDLAESGYAIYDLAPLPAPPRLVSRTPMVAGVTAPAI